MKYHSTIQLLLKQATLNFRLHWAILMTFLLQPTFSDCQKLNYITHIASYEIGFGNVVYDQGGVMFTGDIVDTTNFWGYYIGRLDTAGQLTCFKYYVDSARVKELVFAPILKITEDFFIAMGFAWHKSRPMLVAFNSQCDTLFTKEYLVKPYDSLYYQVMMDIIHIPDDGYVIAGQIASYELWDSTRSQVFILKLDEDFNEVWQTQFGDSRNDYGVQIDHLYPDTVLIIGKESKRGHITPFPPWTDYLHIRKISLNDGRLLWQKKDIPPSRSIDFDFVKTPDNGYILNASELIDSLFANGLPGNLYSRNSVFKLNSSFDIEWEVNYGEQSITQWNKYTDITISTRGDGVVVAGIVLDYKDSIGLVRVISKISWEGDSIWTRYYQPVYPNYTLEKYNYSAVRDKIVSTETGYIIQADVDLDTLESEFPYVEQIWFLQLDEYGCNIPGCHLTTSVPTLEDSISNELNLKVYPNPSSQVASVQLQGYVPEGTRLQLFDLIGNKIMDEPVSHSDLQFLLHVSELMSGTYFLRAIHQDQVLATEKIIVID